MGPERARRGARALSRRAGLSPRAGDGRRQALRLPRRRARHQRHRGDVRRVLRRFRSGGPAVRAARQGGAEGVDPPGPVPRARRCRRSLLGRRDSRLVPGSRQHVSRLGSSLQRAARTADIRPMERASAAARVVRPIDVALLAAAARTAAAAIGDDDEPVRAIEAAVDSFYDAVAGVMPSVFVLEHGRLWLVAQRGYAVVPDGITVESGITGRAVRLGRAQLAPDVTADPDYVAALPGVVSELAIPLRSGTRRTSASSTSSPSARFPTARPTHCVRSRARSRRLRRGAPCEPDARSRRARAALRSPGQPARSTRHRRTRRRIASQGASGRRRASSSSGTSSAHARELASGRRTRRRRRR